MTIEPDYEPKYYAPFENQSFASHDDWVRTATRKLTSHPDYRNTEHGCNGYRGYHFTAMCFDGDGKRCRNGGDFQSAKYPVWYIWPDQICAMIDNTYRNEYKSASHDYMSFKDDYSEIVRALGYAGVGWWDDPIVSHKEIMEKIKGLVKNDKT